MTVFVLVSFPYFVDLNAQAVSCVAGIIIKSPSVVGFFLDCLGILSQLQAAFAFSVPQRAVCPTEVRAASFHYLFILLSTDIRLWGTIYWVWGRALWMSE